MPSVFRNLRPLLPFALSFPLIFNSNFARTAVAQDSATIPPANADVPKEKTVSFAKAIASARLPLNNVVLALEGYDEEKPELTNATIEQVAAQYGKLAHDFNWVQAIGPEKTVQLETNLGEPNPYADMPADEACTLLMSLLTDAQRSKAMSSGGLGLADLTETDQKQLFKAILPKGSITYDLYGTPEEGMSRHTIENATEKFANAKLRLGNDMAITSSNHSWIDFYKISDSPALCRIQWDSYPSHAPDEIGGMVIRTEMPNRYKIGNLNVYAALFRKEVALSDLKTVADLVARIRKQSGVELYADVHYEKRKLILKTGRPTAPMSDLLRALAFCVGGTYRKVGTAYVLTNDLKGVGTRRQIIKDFIELGAAMRYKPVKEAENSLLKNPALQKTPLPLFDIDNSLNPTPEQKKQGISLPYEQLNANQKAVIDAYIQVEKRRAEKDSDYDSTIPDLSDNYTLSHFPSMQLLAPGFDFALRLPSYCLNFLDKDFSDKRFDKDHHILIRIII